MTRRRHSFDEPRIGGFTVPTLWRLVRWAVRGLIVLQVAARALPAGRARRRLLRELGQGLGILETAVRCLLLMVRTPVHGVFTVHTRCFHGLNGPPEPVPEDILPPCTCDTDAILAGLAPAPRFSLYMKELTRPAGQGAEAPSARQRRQAAMGSRPDLSLARRLAALRHALAHPEAEATRMAAYMMARGYRRRALRPLRPWAGFGPGRAWTCFLAAAGTPFSPDAS